MDRKLGESCRVCVSVAVQLLGSCKVRAGCLRRSLNPASRSSNPCLDTRGAFTAYCNTMHPLHTPHLRLPPTGPPFTWQICEPAPLLTPALLQVLLSGSALLGQPLLPPPPQTLLCLGNRGTFGSSRCSLSDHRTSSPPPSPHRSSLQAALSWASPSFPPPHLP